MTVPEGPLDSAALLELICAPGFSTREVTDRGSGRGIGMAVVKSTIQQLSGALSLHTEPGRGTRFTIELPLTLSITEAMIAVVGNRTFAVPQGSVREVIRSIRRLCGRLRPMRLLHTGAACCQSSGWESSLESRSAHSARSTRL